LGEKRAYPVEKKELKSKIISAARQRVIKECVEKRGLQRGGEREEEESGNAAGLRAKSLITKTYTDRQYLNYISWREGSPGPPRGRAAMLPKLP
jgi:hypothetical protein